MPISKKDIINTLEPATRKKSRKLTDQQTLESIDSDLNRTESINAANPEISAYVDITTQERTEELSNQVNTTNSGIHHNKNMQKVETYSRKKEQPDLHGKSNGGIHSFFNPYSVFTFPGALDKNDFLDIEKSPGLFTKEHRELSLPQLLKDFSKDKHPSEPLFASNFMYCKYYDILPLNRIITLRRFLSPTYDNLKFPATKRTNGQANNPDPNDVNFWPIAQAVTYFGGISKNDFSEMFKMSGTINWEEVKASIEDVQGNEQGFDSTPFVGSTGTLGGLIANFTGGGDTGGQRQAQSDFQREFYGADTYFQHTNRTLGPVNVIDQTMTRGRGIGGGIDEINLAFEYELRSYDMINPRLAMIDIICNMLALSFNNAKFWGGMNRYFPNHPQFEFFGDQKAFYDGRYGDYIGSVIEKGGAIFGKAWGLLAGLLHGLIKNGGQMIGQAAEALWDAAKGALNGNFDPAKQLLVKGASSIAGSGLAKPLFDLAAHKSRPKMIGFKSLVSGLPVGEWHLTVGNPYNPTFKYGNLICKGFDMEFGKTLGFDDFPDELTFNIKLAQGRPRDKGDLESIFNYGQGRIYYPPDGLIDLGNISSGTTSNTKVATNIGKAESKKIDNMNKYSESAKYGENSLTAEGEVGFGQKLIGTIY